MANGVHLLPAQAEQEIDGLQLSVGWRASTDATTFHRAANPRMAAGCAGLDCTTVHEIGTSPLMNSQPTEPR